MYKDIICMVIIAQKREESRLIKAMFLYIIEIKLIIKMDCYKLKC